MLINIVLQYTTIKGSQVASIVLSNIHLILPMQYKIDMNKQYHINLGIKDSIQYIILSFLMNEVIYDSK